MGRVSYRIKNSWFVEFSGSVDDERLTKRGESDTAEDSTAASSAAPGPGNLEVAGKAPHEEYFMPSTPSPLMQPAFAPTDADANALWLPPAYGDVPVEEFEDMCYTSAPFDGSNEWYGGWNMQYDDGSAGMQMQPVEENQMWTVEDNMCPVENVDMTGACLMGSEEITWDRSFDPCIDDPAMCGQDEVQEHDQHSGGVTTVMLRNVPNKCTREMLVDQLNNEFRGRFDFVYLPIDFKNGCNIGYGFINFRTPEDCSNFVDAFNGVDVRRCFPNLQSRKIVEVTPARVQGLEENVRRLRCSPVMSELLRNPEWMPLMLGPDGEEVEFPAPEMPVPPVRPRGRRVVLAPPAPGPPTDYGGSHRADYRDGSQRADYGEGGQRTDYRDGNQRTDYRDQRSDYREQRTDYRDQRSEWRDHRSDWRDHRSDYRDYRSDFRDQRADFREGGRKPYYFK